MFMQLTEVYRLQKTQKICMCNASCKLAKVCAISMSHTHSISIKNSVSVLLFSSVLSLSCTDTTRDCTHSSEVCTNLVIE